MTKREARKNLRAAVAASAIVLSIVAGAGQAQAGVPVCKIVPQIGVGISPAHAQQSWTNTVVGKLGPKWAQWVGAKNKSVTGINGGTLFQAKARPCFYQPVL